MISIMSVIRVLSNLTAVFSAVRIVAAFGISKIGGKKRRAAAAAVNAVLAVVVSAGWELKMSAVSSVVYPLMFLTAYLIVFGELKMSHIYIALITESVTSLLSSGLCILADGSVLPMRSDFQTLSLLTVRTAVLLTAEILLRSGKARKLGPAIKIIPKHIFILTALSVLFISLLSENNGFAADDSEKRPINTVLISALTVSLIIMILSLLINVAAKKQFSETNSVLRSQVEIQVRHYKRLEQLSKEIRSFMHDYTNHIRSLLSLLEMEQYGDATEYVEKLASVICPGRTSLYQTGNPLADAILTDKSDLCGEYAKIVFCGFIPDKIDNVDLCVILSNALDNAAEACAVCEGVSSIEIFAQVRQGYFVLTIKNPTADGRTYRDIPETAKSDVLNHGFGLKNIEAAVVRLGGRISINCENNVFELSLTFKLPEQKQ
ncbi:MAG: GHKL domain-containing protein [Prevotella sp.]|nr:GHKL domain-containing protein [Prevotella sp.]